jgi:Arc/MetJ-type ribon-helix-helix transcriptional regulator
MRGRFRSSPELVRTCVPKIRGEEDGEKVLERDERHEEVGSEEEPGGRG